MAKKRPRSTSTSSFGSQGRISHDSSKFYESKLYDSLPQEHSRTHVENAIPEEHLDRIWCGSAEQMKELPDESVHLMITSPPYNVGKDYDEDLTLGAYLRFLGTVWKEVYRTLVPGGRACINIANLGRKPYIPLNGFIALDMIDIGFLMRGEIIWDKGASAASSTAWGSWQSASNPVLRDVHEYILVFSKDMFQRGNPENRENTIGKEDFLKYTKSVWSFPAETATRVGHPAPFPVELPYRIIQLYSFSGEVVLDPFMGSGQTAIAACKASRHYVGYEIDEKFVKLANERIASALRE
jgi:modification methylase